MTLLLATERLRESTEASRVSLVEGTPERYTRAELRGFSILDAEELLRSLDRIRMYVKQGRMNAVRQEVENV